MSFRPGSRCTILLLAVGLLAQFGCGGEGHSHIVGTLEDRLSPANSHLAYEKRENLRPMSPQDRVSWKVPAGMLDQVFEAEINWAPDQTFHLVVVEPRQAPVSAYLDLNGNKKLEVSDLLSLEPSRDPEFTHQGSFEVPLEGSPFPAFPVRVKLWKNSIVQNGQVYSARAVAWNRFAALRGNVEIDGQQVALVYEGLLPGRWELDPKQAILGIDGDLDGEIDFGPLSPEWSMARNEDVILRVGTRYVSFHELEPLAGRVALGEHDPSEYTRIELRQGAQIPNFSFQDFHGKRRSLGEFRGKFLLLDFWGSWCGPCIAEFPNLVQTYSEFADQGFEILGMNADPAPQELRQGVTPAELDQGFAKAQATVQKFAASWPQAKTDSIMKLVLERFRIYAYPTSILLDPEGRIVSTNEADLPLRGPGLKQTLTKLMK